MYRNIYKPKRFTQRMQSQHSAQQDSPAEQRSASARGTAAAIVLVTPAGAEAVVAAASTAQRDDQGVQLGESRPDQLQEDAVHRAAASLLGVTLESASGAPLGSAEVIIGQEAMRDGEWPVGVAYCKRLLVDAAVLQAEEAEMLNVVQVWLPHILNRHQQLLGGDARRLALETAMTSPGDNITAATDSAWLEAWRLLTGARAETQVWQDREDTAATEAMDEATDEVAAEWSSDYWQQFVEPVWWEFCTATERLRAAERDAAFLGRLAAEA